MKIGRSTFIIFHKRTFVVEHAFNKRVKERKKNNFAAATAISIATTDIFSKLLFHNDEWHALWCREKEKIVYNHVITYGITSFDISQKEIMCGTAILHCL